MKAKLSQLVRVPLRDAWKHEASEFTPWLAETDNLNLLSDALGLGELELVATEHWVGGFKLDILCTDGTDKVIIENQLERTNHGHLGQIITYAAGIGARKVIWVAESFRPEHVAALEFLNQNTTEDLNFFAVQVELYRIGDSPMAPKFEVVVKPNEWTKVEREQARAVTSASSTKQRQLAFWTALVDRLAKTAAHIRTQSPRAQHWQQITLGRSGFIISCTANHRESRLGVEIYINNPESKLRFKQLFERRSEIENAMGLPLDWQELPDAHACRIALWRPESPLSEESRWDEYLDWMTAHVVRMEAVFRPIIRALP